MGISRFTVVFLIAFFLARAEGLHRVRLRRGGGRLLVGIGSKSDFICNSCLDVSRQAEKILADPNLEKQVAGALSEVCHVLPADSVPKCLGMLNEYIEQAISFLRNFFNEENLCYSSGLCSQRQESFSSMLALTRKMPSSPVHDVAQNEVAVKLSDEKTCTSCHNAVDEILKWLEDPEAKLKLIKALLKACDELDVNAQKCKKMVFQYGPLIFANLENYVKNNDVCSIVQLCNGPRVEVMAY